MKENNLVEFSIRVSNKEFEILKKIKNNTDYSVSNISKILIFGGIIFENDIKQIKKEQKKDKLNKTILIFFKKDEYDYLEKIANEKNMKKSALFRNLIVKGINLLNTEYGNKILFLTMLDKSIGLLTLKKETINVLYQIYKKTGLKPCDVLEKLLDNKKE